MASFFLVLSRRENDSLERPEVVYQLVEDGSDSADLFYLTYVIQTEQAKLCYAEEMIEFCIGPKNNGVYYLQLLRDDKLLLTKKIIKQ